jgi:hypothetical protein
LVTYEDRVKGKILMRAIDTFHAAWRPETVVAAEISYIPARTVQVAQFLSQHCFAGYNVEGGALLSCYHAVLA